MEEDLKILEDFIKYFEAEAISRKYRRNISITVGEDDIQAIENLIAENKQLKDDLYASNCIVNEQIDVLRDSVLKSKIEEFIKSKMKYLFVDSSGIDQGKYEAYMSVLNFLQEN